MKELQPPHDPIEAMGEAYELLYENAAKKGHQSGGVVHDFANVIRDEIKGLGKVSDAEVDKLEMFVKRDLVDAAQYVEKTGKELKDWLGFDVALMKQEFWERFSKAADQTTTALYKLKEEAELAGYHSGEIIGLGTLVCDECGEKLHFHKPGHIPPCPKCKHTSFHRPRFG